MRKRRLFTLSIPVAVVVAYAGLPASASSGSATVPSQGTQQDWAYANSYSANGVKSVFATTQQTSCYTPEVQYGANAGPNDGYSGETACGSNTATTLENQGPYAQQSTSNPGYGVGPPDLVKNHSESDIRVDPTNPMHLIGSVKWIVSAEGYNHLLGFYESWDGGQTWPVQGHIPGYEGWTDNTDPVGAFDGFGNNYQLLLPYQFFYNSDGSHNFATNPNKEPNPGVPAEVISIAVHPAHPIAGVPLSQSWITTHNNAPDYVAIYPKKGQEPDKQWITIDTNPKSPFYNTIYAMWAVFDGINSKPYVSTAKALWNGTHTDWSAPVLLPTVNNTASDTYLLPHVTPDGTVYTSITNFPAKHGYCCITVSADKSSDGGKSWTFLSTAVSNIPVPAFVGGYANTTFTDGIDNTFTVGLNKMKNGNYPLYIAYNQESAGVSNVLLTASFDGGLSWSAPIQVNDNMSPVDEFQPNLAAAANGTVSVNFYDRRLACPAAGTAEATGAGLALDLANPNYSGSLPPYGASNYCVNTSIQFYSAKLAPIGHNTRLSQHSWDPQLNSPRRFCVCYAPATFIGDYFGNTINGSIDYTTSVSTYNDTLLPTNQQNPSYYQQQVVASIAVP